MITRQIRIQLVVFALITVVIVAYGATKLLGLGAVLNPPYLVEATFTNVGGIYPRADVDLLGTRVGRVKDLRPGPDASTIVVLAIDDEIEIPADVRAIIGSKSAIGEGFVELEPLSTDGELLGDGDVIPLERTVSPPDLGELLGNVDALAASVPTDDLAVFLEEASTAVDGLGPTVGRLITSSRKLAEASLNNVEDLTALIRDAGTVLDTQVELGAETAEYTTQLAGLTAKLREVDPTFVSLYDSGLRASTEVTNLLDDNQALLPVLLTNLLSVTTVASDRIPALRKALVVFPWVIEQSANIARHCDEYDIDTGEAVEATCHYDDDGEPIYTLHLAQQFENFTPTGAISACTRGYGGTERYRPDGVPVDGTGGQQPQDAAPNPRAHCAAPPTDPHSPNVRGSQNVTIPAYARDASGNRAAIYNPRTGVIATENSAVRLTDGGAPPVGAAGLGWLLVQPLG
ncbi:MAG: MlaD family protein [Nocardioides sp.]